MRTVRGGCPGWLVILGFRHLEKVLAIYVRHYNEQRPHRSLDLKAPETWPALPLGVSPPRIRRNDQLGGLLHEYERAAWRICAPYEHHFDRLTPKLHAM